MTPPVDPDDQHLEPPADVLPALALSIGVPDRGSGAEPNSPRPFPGVLRGFVKLERIENVALIKTTPGDGEDGPARLDGLTRS
jgi:hypothetical protein